MKTIKFLALCRVADYRLDTPEEERYEAGQTVSMSDESAQHWLSRGKAEELMTPALPEQEKASASSQPELLSGGTEVDKEPSPGASLSAPADESRLHQGRAPMKGPKK